MTNILLQPVNTQKPNFIIDPNESFIQAINSLVRVAIRDNQPSVLKNCVTGVDGKSVGFTVHVVLDGQSNTLEHAAHFDDLAVSAFATRMKQKMADSRLKGRSGWHDKTQCNTELFAKIIAEHLHKDNEGNLIDLANLLMMLDYHGGKASQVLTALKAYQQAEPVAYMFPHDLELFERAETTAHAYSVAMGSPEGETVPLYTEPQIGTWINADETNRLVRELDVAINGEAGAAKQASLCDIVAQVKRQELRAVPAGYVALPSDPDKVAQIGLYWLREHHNPDCAIEWGDFCAMWADIVERHADSDVVPSTLQGYKFVPADLLGACAYLARQHAPKLHAELVTVIFGKDHPHAKADREASQ